MGFIKCFCDGGCKPNPGLGAWAYVVYDDGCIVANEAASVDNTTNNQMELTALIKLLRYLGKRPAEIAIDSAYVVNGITQWIINWKRNGWVSSTGGKVQNKELWMELDQLFDPTRHALVNIKGHSGIQGNDLVDQMCTHAINNHVKSLPEAPQVNEPHPGNYSTIHTNVWFHCSNEPKSVGRYAVDAGDGKLDLADFTASGWSNCYLSGKSPLYYTIVTPNENY